ncbi:hypothetical protein N0V83_004544 [Neocucurbitaria cava]|uniref:Uncharacterized protein n=1 Tax=Neocucurbitaria cava TaxID=798079 RepID=A0A9W9CNA0_9PLEO|nr:hypothetical protein N0V83_004544 [Neocucurbitaria cava]
MTEVLAVFASGINVVQLAVDILKSTARLKRFWNEVEDVPNDLHQLLNELDTLGLMLCQMESNQNQENVYSRALMSTSAKMCTQKSLELCRKAAKDLGGLVEDMGKKIDGRKGWRQMKGCVKVALKAKELQRLQKRMQDAIRLLNMAYQCYISAMIQAQPEVIASTISSMLIATAPKPETDALESDLPGKIATEPHSQSAVAEDGCPTAECFSTFSSKSWVAYLLGTLQYRQSYHKSNSEDRPTHQAKYSSPTWISERGWDMIGFRTQFGWQFNLRSFRRLPTTHKLFGLAARGAVTGVHSMLANGEASVMDVEYVYGQSALHIAAREGQLEVCKLLIDSGADPLARSDNDQTPLHTLTFWASHLTFHRKRPAWEICRLLVNSGADESLIEDVSIIARRNVPVRMMEYLISQVFPSYGHVSAAQRFQLARKIRANAWGNVPDLVRLVLGCSLDQEVAIHKDSDNQTLLHYFALW